MVTQVQVQAPPGPAPIFVLGLQRSGTTWLANVLAGHPEVAAVEAADHQGVHESIFFSHFARAYGDLADDANFDRFATDFTACDYYLLSGLEESWLREHRPRTYPDAFRSVMGELARRQGAHRWLEKSPHHSLLAPELADAFPDARFVSVIREPADLIRSRLWAFRHTPPPYPRRFSTLLRACAAVSLYQRRLVQFTAKCDRAILTSYEALRHDLEGEVRRLSARLDLEFDPRMVEPRYDPNSSFGTAAKRDTALSRLDRGIIRAAMAVMRCIPLPVLEAYEDRRRRRRGLDWPDWCWARRPRPSQAE